MTSVERWVLSNGLTVLYRQSSSIPLAAATLLIRAGGAYETRREAGLANLAVELWMQGTRHRSARRIADMIESIGASLGAQASEDHVEMGFIAPAKHWMRTLDVMADILLNASFPPQEIVKERAQTLASLASRHDNLFTLAHDHFNAALYRRHPYGHPVEGFPETVKRFTRRNLMAWHQAYIRPGRSVLSIVAPFPAREAAKRIADYFSGWKGGGVMHRPPDAQIQDATLRASDRHVSDLTPGGKRVRVLSPFQQAYLMVGVLAPCASDPDYLTLKVLNTIMGGGMSSRLFLKLREELGLAYEVASFFPTRIEASQWVVYLGLPAEKLKTAEQKLNEILRQLFRRGVTLAEVKQAKQMIKGAYVMEHQTRRRQAWYAAWWEFLGKGPDFDALFPAAVDAVTPTSVQSLARRLLEQPRVTVEVIPKT